MFTNPDHSKLQDALIEHFGYEYVRGHVYWPKRFTDRQKSVMSISVPSVVSRINTDLTGVLYHIPSKLLALNRTTNQYTSLIGDGLFSRIAYKVGDTICSFIGEIVTSTQEVDRREALGEGGYTISLIHGTKYLDCFHYRHVCMASYANDPRKCMDTVKQKRAKANCECRMNSITKNVMLKATRSIPANTEILWVYGDTYW